MNQGNNLVKMVCGFGLHIDRVKEMVTFFNKTITKRTPAGQRQSVQNESKCSINSVVVEVV